MKKIKDAVILEPHKKLKENDSVIQKYRFSFLYFSIALILIIIYTYHEIKESREDVATAKILVEKYI